MGGDLDAATGPFADAASLLKDDMLTDYGIREVGFAGYPKGHPRIQTHALTSALDEKLALAERQGLGSYVISQFCFAPNRITHFCTDLKRHAPEVPVYVGVPGPVSPQNFSILRESMGSALHCGPSKPKASAPYAYSHTPIRPNC